MVHRYQSVGLNRSGSGSTRRRAVRQSAAPSQNGTPGNKSLFEVNQWMFLETNDWELKKSVARQLLSRRGIDGVHINEIQSNFEQVTIEYWRLPENTGLINWLLGRKAVRHPVQTCVVKRSEFR